MLPDVIMTLEKTCLYPINKFYLQAKFEEFNGNLQITLIRIFFDVKSVTALIFGSFFIRNA